MNLPDESSRCTRNIIRHQHLVRARAGAGSHLSIRRAAGAEDSPNGATRALASSPLVAWSRHREPVQIFDLGAKARAGVAGQLHGPGWKTTRSRRAGARRIASSRRSPHSRGNPYSNNRAAIVE